jgi:UDPglucose 6-dehydrogenase
MAALATRAGAFSDLADATDRFNRAQIGWIAELTRRHYSGKGPVGILGLTYKPDTDVVEESFGMLLAGDLTSANVPVIVYDPSADANRVASLNTEFRFVDSAQQCIQQSDVVVVATPWVQFQQIPYEQWVRHGSPRTVVDCWQALPQLNGVQGVRYVRLGFGEEVERAAETGVGTD